MTVADLWLRQVKDHSKRCPRFQCFLCPNVYVSSTADCGKSCDSTNAADHQGQLYCKGCHGKHFGTKGVGFGIGAGALHA